MRPYIWPTSSSLVILFTLACGACSQHDAVDDGSTPTPDAVDAPRDPVLPDADLGDDQGASDASNDPVDEPLTDLERDRAGTELADRGRADLDRGRHDPEVSGTPDSATDSDRTDPRGGPADGGGQDAEVSISEVDAEVDAGVDGGVDGGVDVEVDGASDPFEGLDEFIERKLSTGLIPGLGAAVVANGEVVWAEGFGWANVEEGVPATADTPFMLASISKLVTGTALMQAVEAGAFTVDTPVNDLLPFALDNPLVTGEVITVQHLVTHTSSIKDNWSVWGSLGDPGALYTYGDSEIPLAYFLVNFLVEAGEWYDPSQNFLSQPPGERYYYSNVGADLAGYLLEVATPLALDDHSDLNIFGPLAMTNSGWHLADFDPDLVAMPYGLRGDEWDPYGHFGYPDYPSGQLRTSARDLGRFLAAYSNGGELDGVRILDDATVVEMFTPQLPEVEPTQGIVWYQYEFSGRALIGHSGSDYGTATEAYLEPATGIGIVVLANVDWSAESTAAILDIERRLFELGDALSEP